MPPGPNDRYYWPYRKNDDHGDTSDSFRSPASFVPRPGMTLPQRKPVAANAGGEVSPPGLAYHLLSPNRQPQPQQQQPTSIPQRVDTVSSGGKFSVSPASSVHEGDGEDGYGYVGTAGLSPASPLNRDVAAAGQGDWRGVGFGGAGQQAQTTAAAGQWPRMGNNIPVAPPQAPGLWDVPPDPNDIPLPAPAHWRGSRELQELANARAREAMSGRRPSLLSYGPAPGPGSVSAPAPVPIPAPVVTPPGNEIAPVVTSVPWQSQQATPQDRAVRDNGNVNNDGNGPFMHYEDLDYFRPAPESEPKDESQIDGGVPRADTFPPIPEGLNRLRARRSWDRQRKRRRKKMASDAGTGDDWGRRGRLGAAWQYCAHWLPEISCCLLSLGLFAAIIAVLRLYDGRGLPDWPLTVSLNTVVAFLAAMCEVALIIPLTEGLSQLKWNSFARGERPLADFQTFEDAKRGPVGSARLLYKRKGRWA